MQKNNITENKKNTIWDYIHRHILLIICAICFIISIFCLFIEYQYKTKSQYALATINNLWVEYGTESDSYYVSYSFIDSSNKYVKDYHSISRSWWEKLNNNLNQGHTEGNVVQYILDSRSRLLGKTNWVLITILLTISALTFYCNRINRKIENNKNLK